MATVIEVKNGNFIRPIGTLLPVMDGRLLWSNFGRTIEASCENYAAKNRPLIPVNTPTIHEAYISCTGASPVHCLQTDVIDADEMTIVVVARDLTTNPSAVPRLVSNQGGGGGLINLSYPNRTSIRMAVTTVTGPVNLDLTNTNTNWGLFSSTYKNHESISFINHTTNASSTASIGEKTFGHSPLRIGAGYQANSPNSLPDVAFVAMYDRQLSSDEIAAVVTRVRQLMADKSITV